MQNKTCTDSDHAVSTPTPEQQAIRQIFTEANRLHKLTIKLFDDTPYQHALWPEIWQYMAYRMKSHISAESYDVLMQNEHDIFSGKTAPVRFRTKLAAFDAAFDAEIPNVLKTIEHAREVLTVTRLKKAYKPSDVRSYFAGLIINRPRKPPFPGYDFGVGKAVDDEDDDPSHARCKNGRKPGRIYYMTTELVFLISILMGLPREEIFMALFPYKMRHTLTEEWSSLNHVIHSYYDNLNHYANMEVIFDDLLTLISCYFVYTTKGTLHTDSEKILVFLTSVCKQALQIARFAIFVARFADTDSAEGRLQVVFNILFPKSIKHFAALHRRLEASREALCGVTYCHIKKLHPEGAPNPQVLYPTFA